MASRRPVPRRRHRRWAGMCVEGRIRLVTNRADGPTLRSLTVAALFASFTIGCHSTAPTVIDRAMASCVPIDSVILAGVDCDGLRAAPVYQKLPAAVTALLEPLRPARYLLLA